MFYVETIKDMLFLMVVHIAVFVGFFHTGLAMRLLQRLLVFFSDDQVVAEAATVEFFAIFTFELTKVLVMFTY